MSSKNGTNLNTYSRPPIQTNQVMVRRIHTHMCVCVCVKSNDTRNMYVQPGQTIYIYIYIYSTLLYCHLWAINTSHSKIKRNPNHDFDHTVKSNDTRNMYFQPEQQIIILFYTPLSPCMGHQHVTQQNQTKSKPRFWSHSEIKRRGKYVFPARTKIIILF